jgi:hypothetical protein
MSELHPKTAKPPLVRHAVRTRDRHDFGVLEIRTDWCPAVKNSDQSQPPPGFDDVILSQKTVVMPLPRHSRARPWTAALPTPRVRRGQRRLAGRRSATDRRLPATIAFGLTRRDAACPSDTGSSTTSPSLQAIAIDDRPRFARAAAPGARRTGTCGAPYGAEPGSAPTARRAGAPDRPVQADGVTGQSRREAPFLPPLAGAYC